MLSLLAALRRLLCRPPAPIRARLLPPMPRHPHTEQALGRLHRHYINLDVLPGQREPMDLAQLERLSHSVVTEQYEG